MSWIRVLFFQNNFQSAWCVLDTWLIVDPICITAQFLETVDHRLTKLHYKRLQGLCNLETIRNVTYNLIKQVHCFLFIYCGIVSVIWIMKCFQFKFLLDLCQICLEYPPDGFLWFESSGSPLSIAFCNNWLSCARICEWPQSWLFEWAPTFKWRAFAYTPPTWTWGQWSRCFSIRNKLHRNRGHMASLVFFYLCEDIYYL